MTVGSRWTGLTCLKSDEDMLLGESCGNGRTPKLFVLSKND